MSQPSNEAEVENVLSAIRRLIQDGGAGRQASPLGRLVLTPALRVVEPTGPMVLRAAEPVPAETPPPAEEAASALDRATTDPLVLLNALPEAAVSPPIPAASEEAAPSGDHGADVIATLDAELAVVPEPALAGPLPESFVLASPAEQVAPLIPAPEWMASFQDAPLPTEGLEAANLSNGPDLALAPALDTAESPLIPEAPELADLMSDPGAEDAALAQGPESAESLLPAEEPDLSDLSHDLGADDAALARSAGPAPESLLPAEDPDLSDLSTDPGAEEAALAQAPDVSVMVPAPEPAIEEPVALQAIPSEEAEAPAELTSAAAQGAPGEEGRAPAPDTLSPEPAADASAPPPVSWPDEATLRALVAEAVREELRGELGERLTRNLRKLVRREVMQAIALREG